MKINPVQRKIMTSLGFVADKPYPATDALGTFRVLWEFHNSGPLALHGLTLELDVNQKINVRDVIACAYFDGMAAGRNQLREDFKRLMDDEPGE